MNLEHIADCCHNYINKEGEEIANKTRSSLHLVTTHKAPPT